MAYGRSFYQELQAKLASQEAMVDSFNKVLKEYNKDLEYLEQKVLSSKTVIIGMRLKSIITGQVKALSAMDKSARDYLLKNATEVAENEKQIGALRVKHSELVNALQACGERKVLSQKNLQKIEEQFEEILGQDPKWNELVLQYEKESRLLQLCKDGTENIVQEMSQKRAHYENDVLFMYVHEQNQKRLAGQEVSGIAFFENFVNSLIKYPVASKNYEILKALPEHALQKVSRQEKVVKFVFEEMQDYKNRMDFYENVKTAQKELSEVQREKEFCKQQLVESDSQLKVLEQKQIDYKNMNVDSNLSKAYKIMFGAPVEVMENWIEQTTSREDDDEFEKINYIKKERQKVRQQIEEVLAKQRVEQERTESLRSLISTYKQRDYNSERSRIKNLEAEDLVSWMWMSNASIYDALNKISRHQRFEEPGAMLTYGGSHSSSGSSSSSMSSSYGIDFGSSSSSSSGFSSSDSFGGSDSGFSSSDSF